MKADKFIEVIKLVIRDQTISGVEEILTLPPGRRPAKTLVEESDWFNTLTEKDKVLAKRLIKRAVDSATFNFLCMLDGVSAIESGENKGHLELYYVKDGKKELLNEFDNEFLHDMYNTED
jgi:hypothetical protein